MFFSNGYVETERQRMPQCEENDILRELLLDGDFASPRLPLPSSTRHLGLNKRPHHLELSLPQISFESALTPLARFPAPNSLQSRLSNQQLDRTNSHNVSNNNNNNNTGSYLPSTQSPSLPNSIMNAIISPPRVFIQEFGRFPPPFFHDGVSNMLESESLHDARPVKSVPPLMSCLPPPPLPMLSMPPIKKKKVMNATPARSGAMSSASSSPSVSSAVSSPGGLDSTNADDRKQQRCSHPDCPNLRRSAGFCNRHSGKVCGVAGCNKSALSRGKCPEHGGGSRCKRDGCQKFAQTRGLCKSHGGGRECNVPGCNKNAHQNRLCRSHGGGKRCDFYGCPKWAQRSGFCCAHTKMGHHASSSSSVTGLRALSTTGLSMHHPPILSPPLMSPHRLLSLLP